jgi:hypothetical protein
MAINVNHELATLQSMRTADLRERFAQLHGETSRSNHRDHLIRRIIWRMQALEEGDLEERAARIRARAAELACDADLRVRAPAPAPRPTESVPAQSTTTLNSRDSERLLAQAGGQPDARPDPRLPMPGTVLSRRFRGRTVEVRVLDHGFEYQGQRFRSLSAVAQAVTGAHWNGWLFFGLTSGERGRR